MPYQSNLRIALAQTCPISATPRPQAAHVQRSDSLFVNVFVNLINVQRVVKQAALEKADVVIFPEYFLQGILNEGRQYLGLATDHLTTFLQGLAKLYKISIVGTIVRGSFPASIETSFPLSSPFDHISLEQSGEAVQDKALVSQSAKEWDNFIQQNEAALKNMILKNTAFYIEGESGKLCGEYVKTNLWHPERNYLTAGTEEPVVFETKWGKVGFLICWDVSHPSLAQKLADLDVDIVFAPTYWVALDSEPLVHKHHMDPAIYEKKVLSTLSYSRCFETETIWVMCNAGGEETEGFIGGSSVWAPFKGVIGGHEDCQAGLKVVNVDMDILKDGRETYKIRAEWNRTIAA